MKNLFLLISITISVISCGKQINQESIEEIKLIEMWDVELDDRPKMLVIGDSISIGYTPFLADYYSEYQVLHNPGNGRSSSYGAFAINYWTGLVDKWEICTINHGLWDIGKIFPLYATTTQQYESNMRYEISVLKTKCNKIVAANITRIPINSIQFYKEQRYERNEIFERIIEENNISVCNLYSISETISHLHLRVEYQDDVHYTEEGYEILANEMINCIDSL